MGGISIGEEYVGDNPLELVPSILCWQLRYIATRYTDFEYLKVLLVVDHGGLQLDPLENWIFILELRDIVELIFDNVDGIGVTCLNPDLPVQ